MNTRYKLQVWPAVFIASLGSVACVHSATLNPDSSVPAASKPLTQKISPLLQSAVQQLERGTPPSAFHTGLVRADDQGRLQVYVHVSALTADNIFTLSANGLISVVPSPALRLVQGWIKPSDLNAIAALPFVTRITPPSYAQPR